MENIYYFGGCTDNSGENAPDEQFYKIILPILKQYNIKPEDVNKIVSGIEKMCTISYENGMTNEASYYDEGY